jgi:hypothetical protein
MDPHARAAMTKKILFVILIILPFLLRLLLILNIVILYMYKLLWLLSYRFHSIICKIFKKRKFLFRLSSSLSGRR